jgi:hypothetical protein
VIVNVSLVVCAGFSVLAFLSSLVVWLYSRRTIRNARARCDEGLSQLRQDLELKDRALYTELSQPCHGRTRGARSRDARSSRHIS